MKTFKHNEDPYPIGCRVTRAGWAFGPSTVAGYHPCLTDEYDDCSMCLTGHRKIQLKDSITTCTTDRGKPRWKIVE